MKNLSITVAVVALIAFSLGYFARGLVERTPNISNDADKLAVREYAESPEAQTIVRTDPNDANAPFTAVLDQEAVITTTRSRPRAGYVKSQRDRLGDFFLINGIGADRAEQIVQGLIDADHVTGQKGNALLDRRSVENSELIARGGRLGISLTAQEKAELWEEREALYRQVFGEYYEAHEEYNRSYPQRRRVGTFSSRLQEPLEYAAKETVVRIMYEENSSLESELKRKSAESSGDPASIPKGWETDKENYQERLIAMRSFNDRVMDRSSGYLSPSQLEQFKSLLDGDVRSFELLIEYADVEAGN